MADDDRLRGKETPHSLHYFLLDQKTVNRIGLRVGDSLKRNQKKLFHQRRRFETVKGFEPFKLFGCFTRTEERNRAW